MRRFFSWQRISTNTSAELSASARVRGGGRFRSLSFQALEPRDMKSADVAVALSSAGTTTPVHTTSGSAAQAPAPSTAGNSSTPSQFAMIAANSSATQSRVAMIAANSSATTATSPSATTAVASQGPATSTGAAAIVNSSMRPSQSATASAGGTQDASTGQTILRSASPAQNAAQSGAGGLAASQSSYSDSSNGYGGSSNGYGGSTGGSASPDDGYGGSGSGYGGSTTPSGPTITSFDANQDSSYWSLTGEVTDPNGLAGMSVTFGGLLAGRSTTVGADGSFIYIKQFPAGTQGTVSAYVTDSQGAVSNTAMVYIDA
jgi:hypothetical protein